jgi:hypothetical protein
VTLESKDGSDRLLPVAQRHSYTFYDELTYKEWINSDEFSIAENNYILASELLDKAHLAAVTSLIRTRRWADAICQAYHAPKQFVIPPARKLHSPAMDYALGSKWSCELRVEIDRDDRETQTTVFFFLGFGSESSAASFDVPSTPVGSATQPGGGFSSPGRDFAI